MLASDNISSTSQLATVAKALQFAAADPVFMARLTSMVEQQERAIDAKHRREIAIARLCSQPDCRESQKLLFLENSKGRLYYSGYQWVPDEYEMLERLQLVHCEFGATDGSGLRARIIHLTEAGQAVICAMRQASSPAIA